MVVFAVVTKVALWGGKHSGAVWLGGVWLHLIVCGHMPCMQGTERVSWGEAEEGRRFGIYGCT